MQSYANLLSQEQVERIHEASLEILEAVGLLVRNQNARKIFSKYGLQVDEETQVVKFPRGSVEEFRARFPATFTFRGRDARYDRTIPDDSPLILTGSSAPNIIDPVTGYERRATSADLARISHLVNELPGYDVFSISTLADDAPPGQFSLSRFFPSIRNTVKPVRANTPPEEAEDMLRKHVSDTIDHSSLHYNFWRVLEALGKHDEAKRELSLAQRYGYAPGNEVKDVNNPQGTK